MLSREGRARDYSSQRALRRQAARPAALPHGACRELWSGGRRAGLRASPREGGRRARRLSSPHGASPPLRAPGVAAPQRRGSKNLTFCGD